MRPVQFASTLTGARRHVDKTVSVTARSNFEMSVEDFSEIDRLLQSQGWTLFKPNEFVEADVPKDDAPTDSKKPSVRLRGVLWRIWDQNTDRSEDFDSWYARKMEAVIEHYKQELN
jgi:hypothetical protein